MFKKAILIMALLLLAACGDNTGDKSVTATVNKEETAKALKLAEKVFTKDEISEFVTIAEARQLKAGDKVSVTGDVIGSRSPFVDGRASFIIGDPTQITPCNLKEGDSCKIPWDCCCDTPEDIARATLNIQILDAEGNVLKTGVKGINLLKELTSVVIIGTVSKDSTEQSMIINAETIWVE